MLKYAVLIIMIAACGYGWYEQEQNSTAQADVVKARDLLTSLHAKLDEAHSTIDELNQQVADLQGQLNQIQIQNQKQADTQTQDAQAAAVATQAAAQAAAQTPKFIPPTAAQLSARKAEVGSTYDSLILRDKTTLQGVTVSSVMPDSITFQSDSGITKVKFENLPQDMVIRLGMSQEEADDYRTSQANQQDQIAKLQAAHSAVEAKEQAEADAARAAAQKAADQAAAAAAAAQAAQNNPNPQNNRP